MRINKKKFIYLISPSNIENNHFYNDLIEVFKSKKVSFFQLRLKNAKMNKKILIGRNGIPIDRFGSLTSPSSSKLRKAIDKALEAK